MADAHPELRSDLTALSKRIKDLLPVVRDHVYHPDFGGSFSIKSVLPALVLGLGYGDLEIQGGSAASTALEVLLFDADALDPDARQTLRKNLLSYCERDTLAMVKLHDPSRGFQMRPYHFLSRGRRVACNGRRSNFLPHALHCFCGLRSPTMQPPTTISPFLAASITASITSGPG